ncbi:MAG: histidinol-phosphate transaminase [Ekhidna sp.]
MPISRREWIQKSLLASGGLLVAGTSSAYTDRVPPKSIVNGELLQLNWNENPYGPSNYATQAVNEAMKYANRYPDEEMLRVKAELAAKHRVSASNILLTAGSTEILSLLGQHVGLQKGEILTPFPTFPTALRFGENAGASIKKVSLDAEDRIDLDKVLDAVSSNTKLIFICNPNNPTSTELPTQDLRNFCKKVPEDVLICLDEAYIEYSKAGEIGSMIQLVDELSNLIVCRTFSKAYGLAGLRIGYAVSHYSNINALRERHLGFEISTGWPPLVAARAALYDHKFLNKCIDKNEEGRNIVYRAFYRWGVQYNLSSTNFIYARDDRFDKQVVEKLEKHRILITKWPDMTEHIRISIGKPEEMRRFVEVIEEFLV